ncbi:DNA phosphorothioation-dependent restriction protein DptF [Paraburkholderia terricola]|uniref:DNA phosphorothioation-dependent restriction protein DptF n=1 Tax=Paraburkholderia terricola TaxID=169427 RepID=UPI00285F4970|nr:DNA phosphorothioation-dependent restriction protein DptF [Paraburkholderia terricola]MDR6492807.1 DNA phosphorothioation-dependent restriction protein DptF [Paraburkholderia terricola]
MSTVTLRQALSVLGRSSPFAVSTLSDEKSTDLLDQLKSYLFIEQEIEGDFVAALKAVKFGDVIFLCGSSGDGKSEILTRHYDEFRDTVYFHLDATHSFAPQQSGTQALDVLFDKRASDNKPLAIGVNIGMLANYGKEGADRHADVKAAIDRFLGQQAPPANFVFLDFEQYPKFNFTIDAETYSVFAKRLMQRLTADSAENPFRRLASQDQQSGTDLKLVANFALLGRQSVQETIIDNLFKTRLAKDQFITTRALLDLLHHLLVGDQYLADSLFCGGDSELAQRLSDFDPASKRTQKLDQFVLRYELDLPDVELDEFLIQLSTQHLVYSRTPSNPGSAGSLIRLFYLLRNESIANNYHHQFSDEFSDELLERYAKVWLLHDQFSGEEREKTNLRQFYVNELISAVFNYANRNAPKLKKGELFLGQFGDIELATPVELKGDYASISRNRATRSSHFFAYLKILDVSLSPIAINLSLFELIYKLNRGYRPNKYDKSAVVLLDEIIEQVTEVAKLNSRLKFYGMDSSYTLSHDDEMITVSEAY